MQQPNGQRSKSGTSLRSVASTTDRARTMRQARRHSFFVRFLKYLLPTLAVVLLGAYGAYFLVINKFKSECADKSRKGCFDPGQIKIDPTNLTMENPKYDGFGTDGSHYVIRAKTAVTDLRQTGPVKLTTIDGDITQLTGIVTNLKAVWGTFDQKKDILELYEKIDIDGSTGMKARLTRATIHNKESRIISPEPVYAENDTGNIRSNSMTMNTKSRQATFLNDVHVKLRANPAKPEDPNAAKPKAAAPAMPGLAANSGQPIEVKSEQLDVDDGAKTALFRRNVIAKQGDAILQAPELDVLYEGKADIAGAPAQKPEKKPEAVAVPGAPAAPEEQTKLKLIKARGGVVMTNKDDKAASETLDYDAQTDRAVLKGNVVMTSINERQVTAAEALLDQKADTALITGNVVVVQGKNTMKGRRLFVDRKKGTTRLESPAEAGLPVGRINTVFYQNAAQNAAKPGEPAKPAPKAAGATAADPASAFAFKTDPSQPIEIESETLDVLDQKHNAIYKGNVVAKQGDFVIHTSTMTATYTGQAGIASAGEPKAAGNKSVAKGDAAKGEQTTQLTKVEARGKVVVHGRDNSTATGDEADYDVKTNSIVMRGKITVAQAVDGKTNVVQGPEGSKLYIDMNSGEYKFDAITIIEPAAKGKNPGQPMLSASPAVSGPAAATGVGSACATDSGLICKTGRMRLLLYPKSKDDAKGKAKPGDSKTGDGKAADSKPAEKAAEAAPDAQNKKSAKDRSNTSAWESTTSTSSKP